MITVLLWKEITNNIKVVKNAKLQYYRLKEEKLMETLIFTVMIIATPPILLIDLFVSPFELLYFIVYKLLWKD